MAQKLKYYNNDLVRYEIYKLVDWYDPILRQPTIPFTWNEDSKFLKAEYIGFSLAETLNTMEGLGLSANQVGLRDRVCAVNMGDKIWIMFNPEIISKLEQPAEYAEGCLSYPGLYLKLNRPKHIKVRFQAIGGQFVEQEFDGLTAVCVQHEIDHLDGKVFTDQVSSIKLEQAKRKIKSNLKKMRVYNKQAAAMKAAEEIIDLNSIKSEKPKIQILEDIPKLNLNPPAPPKMPDKFIYKV
jgi:peptide deformylase